MPRQTSQEKKIADFKDGAPEFKALLGRIDAIIYAPKKESTNV